MVRASQSNVALVKLLLPACGLLREKRRLWRLREEIWVAEERLAAVQDVVEEKESRVWELEEHEQRGGEWS